MLLELAAELEPERAAQVSVVTGFDGFVDEFFSAVGTRLSPTAFEPVPTPPTLSPLT